MNAIIVLSTVAFSCLGASIDHANLFVNLTHNARIVNGQPAEDGTYPFQVSLQNGGKHTCGGTILSTQYILTAAHCIYGKSISSYMVRAGTNNYNSGGTVHQVVEWKYHERYQNSAYWNNDIAVLKVSPPLRLSSKVQPTKLPAEGAEPVAGAPSITIGWGSPCSGCLGIADLQEVNLQIYSHNECTEYYGNGPTEDMVCSGIPQASNGICSGDSGGPLLVEGIQIGITSWTSIFCDVYPGVWTKVSHYRSWIKENAKV